MRITILSPYPSLAGGIKVIAIYARKLIERGHDVFVISPSLPREGLRDKARRMLKTRKWKWNRWTAVPSHYDLLGVPVRQLPTYRAVTDADVPDADAVIATWWETAEWAAALSPTKGAKTYLIQGHEIWGSEEHAQRANATWKLPLHKIVVAHWLRGLAHGFGDTDVSVVPNSVDGEQFDAPVRTRQSVPTIGLLYSTMQLKGIDLSLRAIEKVRAVIPELRVEAFGQDEIDRALPLPPGSRFVRFPAQDRIREIYARCDVWVCASRNEGFGLTLLEAMACRCPVISTRCGGPEDFIRDGWNGFLVGNENVDELAERLIHVLRLPSEDWSRLSENAHSTAHGYTWDDAVARLEESLRHSIDKSRSTRPR